MTTVTEQTTLPLEGTQLPAIVKVDATKYGLQATEATQVESVFMPMIQKMAELESEYNDIQARHITYALVKEAKELRLKYVKIRTGTAEIHKKAKEYYLAGGRFIDGWKNAQAFASQGKEEALLAIEQHYENQERERMRIIREAREIELKPFVQVLPEGLGSMADETYAIYIQGAKTNHAAKIKAEKEAAIELARKEEEKAAEAKRIRDENEALKLKAKEDEKKLAEAEAKRIQDKKEADAIIAAAEKKRLQEQKEAAEILAAANLVTERLNKIVRDKEESDRIIALQAEEAKRSKATQDEIASGRPDKLKLMTWIVGLELTVPETNTTAGKAAALNIAAKFAGFKKWANQEIQDL